jgi:4-aminobutyrate aminotransferase-like enzyme
MENNTLTKRQVVAAMKKAGIVAEVRGAGRNWEVELPAKANRQSNDRLLRKFQKNVALVGGFTTGYGAWILRPGYVDKGDWNDKSSAWHY